jgi:hypothetical protein
MQFDMFELPEGVQESDVKAAMAAYIRQNDNWYAHAYDLWLRAEKFDDKCNATRDRHDIRGKISGAFQRAAYGYERNALRAQAHQSYRMAVAQSLHIDDYGAHKNAFFAPHAALMEMVRVIDVQRQNIAHGHQHMYKQ